MTFLFLSDMSVDCFHCLFMFDSVFGPLFQWSELHCNTFIA
jgi:hypothetical protein